MPTKDSSGCSLDDQRQYEGMVGGIAIYFNPSVAKGEVELRNSDGEVIAVIRNVKQIDTSGHI